MNVLKKTALLCAFLLSLPAVAQVVASGSRVQDGTGSGNLLASGTWNFGATPLTVTSGGFSGTVTPTTATVTVKNASSVTILTVPNVTISATFSWDTFVVSGGSTISGTGKPTIACQVGAVYAQTDSTPANLLWTCYNVNGQAVWQITNAPLGPSNVANAVASEIIVTPSATPSFGNLANSTTTILTANVTSWTIASGLPGQVMWPTFCEDSVGGHTLSGTPANVLNFPGLNSTAANSCTTVALVWSSIKMAWIAPPSGTTTSSGVQSALSPLTNCSSAGYVYSPQSNTCILPTASAGGSNGNIQVNSSGALGAATAFNIGSTLLDSHTNFILTPTAPTTYPFPTGFNDYTLLGYQAGQAIGTGSSLVATVGAVAIGYQALHSAATVNGSVAIGSQAAYGYLGTGTGGEDGNNVCIGPASCYTDTSNFETVAIGNKAWANGTGDNSGVYIGTHNCLNCTANNATTVVGPGSGQSGGAAGVTFTMNNDTLLGGDIMDCGVSCSSLSGGYTSQYMIAVGFGAAGYAWSGNYTVAIGPYALASGTTATLFSGTDDFVGGHSVAPVLTTGSYDVVLGGEDAGGNYTGHLLSTILGATIIGNGAAYSMTTANYSTVVGEDAAQKATTNEVDAFGHAACQNATGTNNECLGYFAGEFISTGTNNTIIGNSSAGSLTTGGGNTIVGASAGAGNNSSNDSFLGQNAGRRTTGDAGTNTAMGYEAFFNGGAGTETQDSVFGALSNSYGTVNTALGYSAVAGDSSHTSVTQAVQLGSGTNNTSHTLQFNSLNFLDDAGNGTFKTFSVQSIPTIASAATIAPTSAIVKVSGTTQITTITPPTVAQNGGTFLGCVRLVPTGAFTTATGGNIALGSTAIVDKVLEVCYDGTSWYPSY